MPKQIGGPWRCKKCGQYNDGSEVHVCEPEQDSVATQETLLPCPFCGGTLLEIHSNRIGDYYVYCGTHDEEANTGCGARSYDRKCEEPWIAAKRWNTRADSITETERKVVEAALEWIGTSDEHSIHVGLFKLCEAAAELRKERSK